MTTILAVLFLTGRIINFTEGSESAMSIDFSGIEKMSENIKDLPLLSFLLVIIPLFSFLLLFLFKNRRLQIKMTLLLILLIIVQVGVIAYYSYYIINNFNVEVDTGIKLIIPFFELLLSILAYRSIKKDEDLVRSYDRLR